MSCSLSIIMVSRDPQKRIFVTTFSFLFLQSYAAFHNMVIDYEISMDGLQI